MFAMLEHHKPAKDIYDDGRLFLDFSEQTASLNGKPLKMCIRDRKNRLNCYKARTFQKNFLKNTKEAEQLKSAPLRYD